MCPYCQVTSLTLNRLGKHYGLLGETAYECVHKFTARCPISSCLKRFCVWKHKYTCDIDGTQQTDTTAQQTSIITNTGERATPMPCELVNCNKTVARPTSRFCKCVLRMENAHKPNVSGTVQCKQITILAGSRADVNFEGHTPTYADRMVWAG